MNLKSVAVGCMLALASGAYADNHHVHPQDNNAGNTAAPMLKANYAGYCEIEIINQSYDDVSVSGTFDDGLSLKPFTVYSFEAPHYISLFYYGYCHYGMDLYIDSYFGDNLYSAYTRRETTVRILNYLRENTNVGADANASVKAKVEVTAR